MIMIYKYPIEITDEQEIDMPRGAKILHAGLDPLLMPCIWVKVNTTREPEKRTIYVAGTGNPMYVDSHNYVSTFNHENFVWHVFTPE